MAGIAAMVLTGVLGTAMGLNNTAAFMSSCVAFVAVSLWTDSRISRRRRGSSARRTAERGRPPAPSWTAHGGTPEPPNRNAPPATGPVRPRLDPGPAGPAPRLEGRVEFQPHHSLERIDAEQLPDPAQPVVDAAPVQMQLVRHFLD